MLAPYPGPSITKDLASFIGDVPSCTATISTSNNFNWRESSQPESLPSTPLNQPSDFFPSDEDEELTIVLQQLSTGTLTQNIDTSLTLEDNTPEFLINQPHPLLTSLPPPNPCPLVPFPMSSTTVKPAELQLGKPKAFSGSYETAISWIHSIQFYLVVNETSYNNDAKKIAFTLSYMTEGSALTWADTFWENTINGTAVTLRTWDNFLKKFQQTFKHQDTAGNAISWLSTHHMVKKNGKFSPSLESYISTFQSNTTCAGIMDHNVLISFFTARIPTPLMKQIVTIHPYSFLFSDLLFFSRDYSSIPCHQPADYTCLRNRFLPSASSDFSDSFPLTHMYFFAIPSHSTMFLLLCHCSRTFRVSGI